MEIQHASEREFTFFSKPHCTYSRIDLFLGNKQLLQDTIDSVIHTTTWSDHAPISITLGEKQESIIFNNWRNNPHLISLPDNNVQIQNQLKDFFHLNASSVSNPFTLWASHKALIRGVLIKISSQAKCQRTQQLTNLLDDIKILESNNKKAPNPSTSNKLWQARSELRSLLNANHAKLILKMRANFYAHSNRAGKLMAALIKKQKIKQKIPYIIHPTQSNKMFHPQDFANAFKEYYGKLYNLKDDPSVKQPTDLNIATFLTSIHLPTLSDEQLSALNAPFTIKELSHVISSLPHGKAPGPDGFLAEYYKSFSTILTPYLCHTFNAAVSSGEFPSEMLSANIITLPKPGKEPVSPQNFHPISLLNTDLKVYAKLVAQRLAPFMPNIIHPDQVGFTVGRQAPDGT